MKLYTDTFSSFTANDACVKTGASACCDVVESICVISGQRVNDVSDTAFVTRQMAPTRCDRVVYLSQTADVLTNHRKKKTEARSGGPFATITPLPLRPLIPLISFPLLCPSPTQEVGNSSVTLWCCECPWAPMTTLVVRNKITPLAMCLARTASQTVDLVCCIDVADNGTDENLQNHQIDAVYILSTVRDEEDLDDDAFQSFDYIL
ncbi:hypothetical protein EVAR_47889_1 [Eumeta japonica]|uniref:Uncharacterized protein n=1 Tax=Eumeta variegata TaxID=151549 RepID=A0A4C1Y9C7_EUMVA|nr:hypothetical protein EVAR_47889_1 [Eumeta japonica]